MKYAIVSIGGKQFNIQEGETFDIPGNSVIDPIVMFYSDGKKSEIGTPGLKDINLKLEVVETKNADKIQVKRFKAKSRYKKNKGHKQPLLVMKVMELGEKKEKEPKIEKTEKEVHEEKPVKVAKKVQKSEE